VGKDRIQKSTIAFMLRRGICRFEGWVNEIVAVIVKRHRSKIDNGVESENI
jgi:hypothetical protein